MTSPTLRDARELLDPDRIVVFDGAMGTMLYSKGAFINLCYDQLSVSQPDLVRDVHREYVKAGAEVIETNTFGANRIKLAQYGLEAQVREFNVRSAQIAREAAGDRAWVAGAVGPLGAPRMRRRSLHRRDVLRPRRDRAGDSGRTRCRCRCPRHRADDDRNRLPQPVRRITRRHRPRVDRRRR